DQCQDFLVLDPLDLGGNTQPKAPSGRACLAPAYGKAVLAAGDIFAQTLPLVSAGSRLRGDVAGQLASAQQMLTLGSFYAVHQTHLYAGAGLLSAAYESRLALLPNTARDLTHVALILAPLYQRLGRTDDAEALMLGALRAEESQHGALVPARREEPNGADAIEDMATQHLGLYLSHLADIYVHQGRYTEGLALRNHFQAQLQDSRQQTLARTARYLEEIRQDIAANRADITQPVLAGRTEAGSTQTLTPPDDLVRASAYAIPVRINRRRDISNNEDDTLKSASANPVKLRLAKEAIPGDEYANMPIQLSRMMAYCADLARGEVIAVAAGYHDAGQDSAHTKAAHAYPSPAAQAEHQLGLAVDFEVNGRRMRTADESWLCFTENAYRFGFIASLTGHRTTAGADALPSQPPPWQPAPWHWRFVGRDAAQLFRELGSPMAPQAFLAALECYAAQPEARAPISLAQTCQYRDYQGSPTLNDASAAPASASSNTLTGLRSGDPVTPPLDAMDRALAYGPAFTSRGRFLNAHTLYANALKESEAPNRTRATPISAERSFVMGLLADNYERRGMVSHATALRAQMARLVRARIFALDANASAGTDHTIARPVSKTVALPASYAPGDLVRAADFGIPVSKDPALDEMKIRLAADDPENWQESVGATLPGRLRELLAVCSAQDNDRALSLRSGYRAYKTQASLFQRLRHRGTVTPPGYSEHQTGLGIDIDINGSFMRERDRAFTCFQENAHHYGFILSYPKGNRYLPGKDTFEPWHWRYVGVDVARLFHRSGPASHPQEFLAALPCYQAQEDARTRGLEGDLKDYCLYEDPSLEATDKERAAVAVAAFEEQQRRQREAEEQAQAARDAAEGVNQDDPAALILTPEDAARILNTPTQSGTNR
ncbi:MAG: D-alanyl-D-alanine carboxypeptidase family protein, partial [Pseudomonadota bacterium]